MTTYPFVPNNAVSPPWSQQVTLDGNAYILSAYWSIFGQRWYLQLTTQDGTLVQFSPMIASPLDYDIPLFPGLFTTSTVIYRGDSGQVEIGP